MISKGYSWLCQAAVGPRGGLQLQGAAAFHRLLGGNCGLLHEESAVGLVGSQGILGSIVSIEAAGGGSGGLAGWCAGWVGDVEIPLG